MKRDDKPETATPFVDPVVASTNPQAAAYAKRMAARMGGEQRGGVPISIPPLNMPHQQGMTMADQAIASRPPPVGMGAPSPGIFSSEQASQVAQTMHAATPAAALLPTDLLTEAARQDPSYREGHGAMYAINQPHLAHKYGVLRNGQMIMPQQIGGNKPGKGGLSPKTLEGLEAVKAFQDQQKKAEDGPGNAAEAEAAAGPAGQAAGLAGGDSSPVTPAQRAAQEEALKKMDDFDFNSFRELMMKDLLNNDEQRKIVEDRLGPIDFAELVMNGRVSQLIPVRPGVYEPELQSMNGQEELALKRLLMEERQKLEVPDRYLLDKFQLMTIALGLKTINRSVLPSHTDKDGNFDDAAFWKKFNKVVMLPFHMLASIGVHYFWFDIRVRKLFTAEALKNG